METSPDSLMMIAALLLLAKVAGSISTRLGMPSVLGIIVAGLLAGPALFGFIGQDAFVNNIGQVGVVLLMFLAGLETDPQGLRSVGKTAFIVAIGGMILPLGAGYAIGIAAGMETMHALFLGAILTATSVSITAETLKEMGRARSREGSIIMGAAIIDDVLGVLVLSALVVAESGGSILEPIGKLILFSGMAFAFSRWVMPLIVEHHTRIESPDTRVAMALAMALGFAWVAFRVGGLADVTGAFLAGVMLSRTDLGHHITEPVSRLSYSLFIPIFFVYIGTHVSSEDLTAAPLLCAAIIAVAIATKIIGCGLPALLCRESVPTSLRVGAGMVGRGEIALVVASVGLSQGVVDSSVFSIAIVVTIATTIAAPLLLKAAYQLTPSRAAEGEESPAFAPSYVAGGR
ncbi:MAG: cation:proton antiporter [Tepidiformaceae bacterium]